jgi:hypothetical protein
VTSRHCSSKPPGAGPGIFIAAAIAVVQWCLSLALGGDSVAACTLRTLNFKRGQNSVKASVEHVVDNIVSDSAYALIQAAAWPTLSG